MRSARLAAAVAAVTLMFACADVQDDFATIVANPEVVARALRFDTALANEAAGYDSAGADETVLARWLLPPALQEISGLTLTSDGRLLVHNDERAQIWEVDYRRGLLVKRFSLGDGTLKADFEGIAAANDVVFMLASTGKLYEFHEGANGAQVEYTVHDLKLKDACEFEGVAFDPALNALIMPCKEVFTKTRRDSLIIYRWDLSAQRGDRVSVVSFPLAPIIGHNDWKTLHPSDISVDPASGNYVIIASIEKALVSITRAGRIVFAHPLADRHDQAEGLAITKDGVLIISDEANKHPAAVTLYKWR